MRFLASFQQVVRMYCVVGNSPEPPGSTVIASSNVSEHNGSYEHNLNEELLAFLKGQPGSLLPFIFPFFLEILEVILFRLTGWESC